MSTEGFEENLDRVLSRAAELRDGMASGALAPDRFAAFAKELAEIEAVAAEIGALRDTRREIAELETMARDRDSEAEMRALAAEELEAARDRLPALERRVQLMLLPKDSADERSAILELRAGTGGEEAALFAAELFEMYRRYAALRGWSFETLAMAETPLGGLREGSALIGGRGVFARLKFESGVHRVQRVPATEGSGRIHTSAATVAVLPEAEEVDIRIDEKDLRIDVFRAQGAGGQHVNKTESAVRITHLPTGTVVSMQDEKSQHKNRARAMTILRSRLYEADRASKDAARAADRRSQVGSGDRSERIRTYNFPQGRVTDHRVELTLYKIEKIMSGEALDEIVDVLIAADEAERLAALALQ